MDLLQVQSPASEIKEREGINSLLLNFSHFLNQSQWTLARSLWVLSVLEVLDICLLYSLVNSLEIKWTSINTLNCALWMKGCKLRCWVAEP